MKKYVILTPSVSQYGGSKLYVKNKKQYMESQGWEVVVFSAWNDDVRIPELLPYSSIGFMELITPISKYSKRFVNHKLEYMKKIIGECDECVIESHEITCATWGEMLAKTMRAKHFVFLLAENVQSESVRFREFGKFKLSRGEFYASHKETIMQFFEQGRYSLEESQKYQLMALTSYGTFCEERSKYEDLIDKSRLVLCVFSRLDKPFVKTLFSEIKSFSAHNLELNMQILVIGTGNSFTEEDIRLIFKDSKNVELIFTGHLQPVAAGLLKKTDIVFATAGCATGAKLCKCVTASIDVEDHGVIGIVGIDTSNTTYRTTEPYRSVETFLSENIKNIDYYKGLVEKISIEDIELDDAFRPHYECIYQSNPEHTYYPEKQLFKIGGLRTKAIRILNYLTGDRYK